MCKIIQTGCRPPITPDNNLKANQPGNSPANNGREKSYNDRPASARPTAESESPVNPQLDQRHQQQLDQLRLKQDQERQKVEQKQNPGTAADSAEKSCGHRKAADRPETTAAAPTAPGRSTRDSSSSPNSPSKIDQRQVQQQQKTQQTNAVDARRQQVEQKQQQQLQQLEQKHGQEQQRLEQKTAAGAPEAAGTPERQAQQQAGEGRQASPPRLGITFGRVPSWTAFAESERRFAFRASRFSQVKRFRRSRKISIPRSCPSVPHIALLEEVSCCHPDVRLFRLPDCRDSPATIYPLK